ncbi:imidazole glycerol phosphate synthase subunit HisH [Ferrimicrobium sp.]|uniref:imidazole glycerol phosphate synthase subunit HisH n=1 Tax=Ferrimicrobium sp. TaxID=2926050 RepID=UPI00262E90A2|nr:imidazole glycerol phosphate synthase subunit HisH [Ferrimicrobium sp.]
MTLGPLGSGDCDSPGSDQIPTSMEIAIVDYGIGNLGSLSNALRQLGHRPVFIDDPHMLERYDRALLPGVGHFGACAVRLRQAGFEQPILERVQNGRWLLGICVGMQLFFEGSDESEEAGLGILEGRVERMQPGLRLPEMQWNRLCFDTPTHPLFTSFTAEVWTYFVHSYAVRESDDAIAWEEYGRRYVAAVAHGSLLGFQFHPEKSSRVGLRILGAALGLGMER